MELSTAKNIEQLQVLTVTKVASGHWLRKPVLSQKPMYVKYMFAMLCLLMSIARVGVYLYCP